MALAELCYADGARFWCRHVGDMNVGEFRAARKKEILRPQSHNLIFLPCLAMGHIVQQQQSQNKHGNRAKEGEKEGELVFSLGDIDWGYLPIGRLRRQLLGRKKKSRHLYFPILLLYGAGYDGNREKTNPVDPLHRNNPRSLKLQIYLDFPPVFLPP